MNNRLTCDEIIILQNVSKGYDWIVRDEDGLLSLFTSEPIKFKTKHGDIWDFKEEDFWSGKCKGFNMFNHIFKQIKWEDNKPYKFR